MKYCLLLLLLTLGLASCKKDEVDAAKQSTDNVKSMQSVVTGVNGPTSGAVNQQLAFTLLWPNAGKDSYFHHLSVASSDSTRLVKLFVASDTTVAKTERQTSAVFTFKAAAAGTYYLKFAKPGKDTVYSIIDTVVIK